MRAGVMRSFMVENIGASSSAVKLAETIQAKEPTPASMLGVYVEDAHPFKAKAMGSWKSRARCCRERHPGLCATEAGLHYQSTLAFHRKLMGIVAKIRPSSPGRTPWEQAGMAVFLFQSVHGPGPGPSLPKKFWVMFAFYCGNPKVCSFVRLLSSDEGRLSLQFTAGGDLDHVFGHTFAFELLSKHSGPWRVQEAAYSDCSFTEIKVDYMMPEACHQQKKRERERDLYIYIYIYI